MNRGNKVLARVDRVTDDGGWLAESRDGGFTGRQWVQGHIHRAHEFFLME